MALVVRPQHRERFAGLLRESLRLRRRILVERLGWVLPGDDGEIEADEFDRGGAFHLISLGPDGRVVGTARLTPTLEPNLTCDVLQIHAAAPFPRAADVVESSRLCVDLDAAPEVRKAARADLYTAHYELCLRQGWRRTTGFFYADFLAAFVRAGFAVDHLGPPVRFSDGEPFSFPYVMTTDEEHASCMADWMGPPRLLDPLTDPGLLLVLGEPKAA